MRRNLIITPILVLTVAIVAGVAAAPAAAVSFAGPADFPAGHGPEQVQVADFNGDHDPDLAVTNNATVTILLGDGHGGFSAPVDHGEVGGSVAIADFDGDGALDLAGRRNLRFGDGNGGFSAPLPFDTEYGEAGTPAPAVTAGDWNGDSDPDLAVPRSFGGEGSESSVLEILLGNGDGTFSAPVVYQPAEGLPPGHTRITSAAVGDFNGDGDQDLALADEGACTVTIMLGEGGGGGRFSAPTHYYCFGGGFNFDNPSSVAVGDFDENGIPDLALGSEYEVGAILLGDGAGGFSQVFAGPYDDSPILDCGPGAVAVADLDRDGDQDLAAAVAWAGKPADPIDPHTPNCEIAPDWDVSVILGNGTGGFSPPVINFETLRPYFASGTPGIWSYSNSVAVGDFDGACGPDLAVANTNDHDVSILFQNRPNALKIGKPKHNKNKGTAKLAVQVAGAGALKLAPTKKVKRAKKTATAAGTVKLAVRPKRGVKRTLRAEGREVVKAKVSFAPICGERRTKRKSLALIKR